MRKKGRRKDEKERKKEGRRNDENK